MSPSPSTLCGFNDVPGGATGSELLIAFGPTIMVDIGFDPSYDISNPTILPIPGLKGIRALIDTGATESCIDALLAAQLALPVVDRRQVGGVHGVQEVNIHLAQILVPSLNHTVNGMFAGVNLAGTNFGFQALIGRTFLKNMVMVYHGKSGTVSITRDI